MFFQFRKNFILYEKLLLKDRYSFFFHFKNISRWQFFPLSKVALWNHTVYGATKAAVDSITKAMALELGEYNIRVNAVNPTVVWTDMGKREWSDPEKSKPLLDRTPLHRFAGN